MKSIYTILIIAVSINFVACKEKITQELFTDFELQYSSGKFSDAKETIDQLINKDSTSAFLYNARGMNHLQLEEFELAVNDFDKSISIKKNTLALVNRAEAKVKLKKIDEASEDFKEAIRLSSPNTRDENTLKFESRTSKLFETPTLLEIVYLRGKMYYDTYNLILAYDDFNLCINTAHENLFDKIAEAYYWRGHTLKRMNEINLACEDLIIAAELGVALARKDMEELCQ